MSDVPMSDLGFNEVVYIRDHQIRHQRSLIVYQQVNIIVCILPPLQADLYLKVTLRRNDLCVTPPVLYFAKFYF
jgi:hypothetical protein